MPLYDGSLVVQEIFSSVQGEGPLVGVRQILLRLYGCHLDCAYCDTPETKTVLHPKGFVPETFEVEHCQEPFRNPIDVSRLHDLIVRTEHERGPHHSVAVTGGEPLLQARSLVPLFRGLRAAGLRVYVETAGDLARQLRLVREHVDWIAMDIKFPSATQDVDLFARHAAFLKEACAEPRRDTFAKCVVAAGTPWSEVERAALMTREFQVPLIIQPVTPVEGGPASPSPSQVLEWARDAARINPDVRVIPQVHKLMSQR